MYFCWFYNQNFKISPIKEGHVVVTGSEAHHMGRVRRVNVSDRVELFDGMGHLATAIVTSVNDTQIGLDIERLESFLPNEKGRIIL